MAANEVASATFFDTFQKALFLNSLDPVKRTLRNVSDKVLDQTNPMEDEDMHFGERKEGT